MYCTLYLYCRCTINGQINGRGCEKLPRPEFGATGVASVKNSVFSNPFVEAENAKKAILEKHVKMTPTRDEIKMINGKKICWNFRKGRCRFGHNCKFAHDSDLHRSETELQESGNQTEQVPLQSQNQVVPITEEQTEVDGENTPSKLIRKKRPGLTQGLIPGKKVMKMYKKQTPQDTSWTSASKGNR
ncbi:hypothetical protein ANN_24727 [Periplaneta americana]|uniref:C3H1-type domain-containing protein n=1 Tax=Periplaneta americana TaxID=6978 RepID=A0ABQ8RZN4_PERAM|nr:hypothetical protein ANN_24727 [Periplaneta americana]